MDHDELCRRTAAVRRQAWSTWGTPDDDVLGHLINPMLMGGPRWPNTRQAFQVVRRPGAVMVASDGLADPSDEEDGATVNGLGIEAYAVTTEPVDDVRNTWLFDLVWQTSQNIASFGAEFTEIAQQWPLVSLELYDVSIPETHEDRYFNEERVGVLLGLGDDAPPATVAGPLSEIRLLNVKLLTLHELEYVAEHGYPGRQKLAKRLAVQGDPLVSTLDRPSVI
ncbi:MAG: hypothetical protein ACRDTU_02345 [Micromonosporaceae bacterium]